MVTAVNESPAATVEVSAAPVPPVFVSQQPELNLEPRETPKAQAFVAEPPAPESPARAPEPVVVQQAAPVAAPVAASVAASVVEQAPAPAPAPRAPQADPKELLSSSGLVMIETDPSRSKSYQLEDAPVQLGRARREKAHQAAEPLMQVETKN